MKIAFTSASCASLDFTTVAAMAADLGFDGVELPAFSNPVNASATNAVLTSPGKIRGIFSAANSTVFSLNAGPSFNELDRHIAIAAELNCRNLRFDCDALFATRQSVSSPLVDRLIHFADLAAAVNITVLIENRPLAGSMVAMWHLLDRIDHPAVACCWNTLSAAIAGDLPAVAVPMLNSRIQSVVLQDATIIRLSGPSVNRDCDFGTGDIPIRKTLDRLRGIGYHHGLLLNPAPCQSIEDLKRSLQKSLDVLKRWKVR